jgi:putative chitinase
MPLLKIGSKGDEVKKIQQKLGLTADGIFGKNTEEAIKKFQISNNIVVDGVVGDLVWNKLIIVNLQPTSTPSTSSSSSTIPAISGLNIERLKGHIPDTVISQIPEVASKFGINNPVKLAHFLAQCGHESGGFRLVSENLNYSADGLRKIFPKYFKDVSPDSYARNPQKIASRVYGGRMGNGPEASGEGFKYRGRGYIQLTGKNNYKAFSDSIGVDVVAEPDLVATKYPLLSAAWFFSKNCLGKCVDASDTTVVNVTKCVNGGTIGLPDRLKHFKEYYKLLA